LLPVPAPPPEPSVASLRDAAADSGSLSRYWTFYWAVAAAQLSRWLPRRPAHVLDLSAGPARTGAQAAGLGHRVVEILDPAVTRNTARLPGESVQAGVGTNGSRPREELPMGTTHQVIADSAALSFLADASMDAVIAENRVLSRHLVTESTVAEIARVLRPGGRVLLSVDSLTLGMAILAEQSAWAHLSDVPSAEVVLVPWPDGTITRCFWADQLRELLTDAGLEVEWIKPRTVLSPSTVEHVLTNSPRALGRLVRTELTAPMGDESLGVHLLASARRPD
jgi:SAM-dependent methyltransferase